MSVLRSTASTDDARAQSNRAAMQALVDDLRMEVAKAGLGGPQPARDKHTARGKLLPRERVERLLDPGTPF
ncbi:MAG: methylcrotonoyl-CoA carboxylase, partial [Hyphomonadaceae bacterium]|nr:methylcrotonoyl-CoA carboxylase [Hyphomonadaceae bacterium]